MVSVMVFFPSPYRLSAIRHDGFVDEALPSPIEAVDGDMLNTLAHKKSLVQDEPTRSEDVLFGDL
jgi:hypothetical protein